MEFTIVFGALIGLAVIILFIGIGRALGPVGSDRMEDYIGEQMALSKASRTKRRGPSAGELVEGFDKILRSVSALEQLAQAILRAGLKWTVSEYLAIWVGSTGLALLIGYTLTHTWLAASMIGLVGAAAPYLFLRYREGARLHSFNKQLSNVLTQMSSSMRSGYGLLQAIDFVAHEMPEPAGLEFALVVRDVKLGRTVMMALDDLADRVGSEDLALVITSIRIHHETGGNLAEILDTVNETIRERVRIKGELQSLTAQQRYSGYVLAVLPILLFFVLMLINPGYEARLLTPGPTLCIPVGAMVSMLTGFVIIQRIVSIEV